MKVSRKRPLGANAAQGSDMARRQAAIMLESLSGACGPLEAAEAMGVALVRYYQLEARALAALVAALEPRPRGRQLTAERVREKSELDRRRLERELHRYQALYRAAQKSLGIAPVSPAKPEEKGGKKRRRARRVTRGERLARNLRTSAVLSVSAEHTAPASAGSG